MKQTINASICVYRSVGGGLNELVKTERLTATSKTDLMKQIRTIKREVASLCKYNLKRDTVYCKLEYVDDCGRQLPGTKEETV